MGSFDELEIDGVVWQTKAFGKTMRQHRPGDEVEVRRVASGDDLPDVESYTYDEVPGRYLVEIRANAYALVENGRLVGLASEADREELVTDTFDYRGRDAYDQFTHAIGIVEPQQRTMSPIPRPVPPPHLRRPVRRTDDAETAAGPAR